MYRYFGYDTVDDILNQKYHRTYSIILFCYIFTHLVPILAIFDAARDIVVDIIYRFKVSWYNTYRVKVLIADTEL